MQVVLAGSSGFIGQEILSQCLSNTSISSIIALSRRPLSTANQKLKVIILEDFCNYPAEIIAQIKDADACIWSLGVKSSDAVLQEKVSLHYTIAAMEVFATHGGQRRRQTGQPFRFVFAGGMLSITDQKAWAVFMGDARRIKGAAETQVIEFAMNHEDVFEGIVVRPGAVRTTNLNAMSFVMSLIPGITVDKCAAAMVDFAVKNSKTQVVDNAKMVEVGTQVLCR